MKTRVCRLYEAGDIRVEEQDTPAPAAGEVVVRMAAGGICGSDLHYFQDGGFGTVRVREPIILGHEVAGFVEALGPGVESPAEGMLVAINPSRPCGNCEQCRRGFSNHCLDMRFLGSAMRFPHEQGGFRDRMVVGVTQCVPVGMAVNAAEAACAEPLAVCLHAIRQAGALAGRRVLVTGAGPIGTLTVAAARFAGASEIVATDLQDMALRKASAMGASCVINMRTDDGAMADYERNNGWFDIAFECSAAGPALKSALAAVRPRGTIVQVGVAGDTAIPLNMIVGKEIRLRGTHRFHDEFKLAARLISERRVDVRPIITATFPLADSRAAFAVAGDRSQSCKVQLSFEGATH